jgi:predicted membrane-bound dolichyl-phosphate-mannose-protein mannosyltransferase
MHAGTALFLWKSAKWLPESNGKALLYLYSWNPFVVLQYLADSHNDIIVAFLVLLAAYFLLKNRPIWSVPLLVAAAKQVYGLYLRFLFSINCTCPGESLKKSRSR